MQILDTEVYGFRRAIHGMRNPTESWGKSDSTFWASTIIPESLEKPLIFAPERPVLGPLDLKLLCSLVRAGSSDRKCLRQIMIWADLVLPRKIWCELDPYHGSPEAAATGTTTVRDSGSTMYKLGRRDLVPSDFEYVGDNLREGTIEFLNDLGKKYRDAKGADKLQLLIDLKSNLPEGFLQRATYSMNYETALTMYVQRENHRMPQWSGSGGLCEWIKSLPYMEVLLDAYQLKPSEPITVDRLVTC